MDIAAAIGTLGVAVTIIAIPAAIVSLLGYWVYCNLRKQC